MAAIDAGWAVVGIDIFEAKVAQINSGSSPVEDISDSQLLAAITKGAYSATTDYSLISGAAVIAICVPTPLNDKREPDLTFLRNAASGIAPFLSNETLIVTESTSYPGTLREVIIPTVNLQKPEEVTEIYFASAPERVNPGDPVWNQKNTPRLVGGINPESLLRALTFYRSICDEVVEVASPEVAEAAKLLENTFRLVNIALIYEITQVCFAAGINIQEVIDAASSKPYGFMPFRPSVGIGGHCIPVDPMYLTWWARQYSQRAEFVETADAINLAMPKYIAERALSMVNPSVNNPKVLVLGVAYKSGLGDIRETPVLKVREFLEARGAEVAWYDPLVPFWESSKPVDLEWDCDVAILATNQPGMEIERLIARGIKILDCTNSIRNCIGVTSL
jgi:UDP-N-acetyl-D-glucosamine dehydrogenase